MSPRLGRRHVLSGLAALCSRAALGDSPPAPPPTGRFERFPGFASDRVGPRDVVVWLPPGYDGGGPVDVLYMHDGRNLFDPGSGMGHGPWAVDVHLASLQAAGRVRPTLVVGVDHGPQRWRDYAPAAAVAELPPSLRERVEKNGGGAPWSDQYLEFLVQDLKPWIDARFRTRPGPESTTVMGSSMGGLISLYALCRHPTVFGAAGCLSTHWPLTTAPDILLAGPGPELDACARPFIDWLETHLPRAGGHRLYFDHGTVGLDALYAPYQARVDRLLVTRGYVSGKDARSDVYVGADHNEEAWRGRLATPLSFLLSR
jgi:enterochelin esterase-like enzyme